MRQRTDRIGALVGYVRQESPGRDVWDSIDTDRSAQTVSVATDDGLLLLAASRGRSEPAPSRHARRL